MTMMMMMMMMTPTPTPTPSLVKISLYTIDTFNSTDSPGGAFQ